MPVSKRDKKVSLTKTSKKGMAMKQQLVEDIRKFLDKYDNLFVFTINNMRNGPLKDLREEWKDSRFFFAKKKVMAIALGRTEAEEVQKNIHKLAPHLVGQCGLLFTNRPKDQVVQWFKGYSQMEFAKSGFAATETVTLPAGPLPDFSFSLEPHLRSLGLPTQLEKGKIILREDFTVCTQSAKLTPEQASILKLIGKQMAEFKVKIVCMWSKDGSFERFKVPKAAKQLTLENNTEVQQKLKKKKKKSNTSQSENKTEEEITELFDQQTLKEPEMLKEKDEIRNVEMENSSITKSSKIKSTQLEIEDEIMNEECAVLPINEEAETSLVIKSTKKKLKKAAQADDEEGNEAPEKISQNEEVDTSANTKRSKKKSQKTDQEMTVGEVGKESSEELKLKEELEQVGKIIPTKESPKITRENPRRSMRTPKPVRRSPEEKKQSVKKLTESNKKTKSALKDQVSKSARNTPRKSVSKRIFEEPEDVEMAE